MLNMNLILVRNMIAHGCWAVLSWDARPAADGDQGDAEQ